MDSIYNTAEIIFQFLALNSIYSALLAAVVIFLKLIFPKMPRMLEYGLWCFVLIRLVLPTEFSISYSLGDLTHAWLDTDLPKAIANSSWLNELAEQKIFADAAPVFTWLNLLMTSWFIFSMIVAAKFVSLRLKLRRLLTTAHPVEDYWIVKEINHWRREFSIRRQIIVIDSNDFLSPFTFGVSLPVVFIPEKLLQEKDEKIIGPIIAHELAHVKRFDSLWLNFQNIVQIIYCLNPVLWLTVRRLNSLREEMCDRKVLDTQSIANTEYGKSLLRVLRLNIGQRSPEHFAAFFLSHKQVFKKRIEAISGHKIFDSNRGLQYAVIASFALFFLPLSWQPVIVEEPQKKVVFVAKKDDSPFPKAIKAKYQAPVLLSKNNKNRVSEDVDLYLK